jgi:hypothetical protein
MVKRGYFVMLSKNEEEESVVVVQHPFDVPIEKHLIPTLEQTLRRHHILPRIPILVPRRLLLEQFLPDNPFIGLKHKILRPRAIGGSVDILETVPKIAALPPAVLVALLQVFQHPEQLLLHTPTGTRHSLSSGSTPLALSLDLMV